MTMEGVGNVRASPTSLFYDEIVPEESPRAMCSADGLLCEERLSFEGGYAGKEDNLTAWGMEWLVHPLSVRHFAREYELKRSPVLLRRNVTFNQVMEPVVQEGFLRVSRAAPEASLRGDFVVARATRMGVDVQPFRYWDMEEVRAAFGAALEEGVNEAEADEGAHWDLDALRYVQDEGFSIKLSSLELQCTRHARPLAYGLSKALGDLVQLNIYQTPANGTGFKPHFDSHDVYIVQVAGKKHWRVYERRLEVDPVNDWPEKKLRRRRKHAGMPLIEATLTAGDVLYIPSGYLHDADCVGLDEASVHVTVGVVGMRVADAVFGAFSHRLDDVQYADKLVKRLKRLVAENEKMRKRAVTATERHVISRLLPGTFLEDYLQHYQGLVDKIVGPEVLKPRDAQQIITEELRPVTGSMQEIRKPVLLSGGA
eukprot:g5324.t1